MLMPLRKVGAMRQHLDKRHRKRVILQGSKVFLISILHDNIRREASKCEREVYDPVFLSCDS